jgi:DNA-binding transcriptional MerR regulator/effector-binding domain-containing protein
MFRIGELSRMTSLTIKTIRLYDEKGLLPPAHVDPTTGYRYYDTESVERARIISELRKLDFSLRDIAEICSYDEETDILSHLERQRARIEQQVAKYRDMRHSIETIIRQHKEASIMIRENEPQVEEKQIGPLLIAGIRTRGRYVDCGPLFGKIARAMGRNACGPPFNLYYDGEYKEDDADFEACFPIKKLEERKGISARELEGGRCVSLVHLGPYSELGRSYEKLFAHIHEAGLEVRLPLREHYIKGPGMIFRGNPDNYVTELQALIEDGAS